MIDLAVVAILFIFCLIDIRRRNVGVSAYILLFQENHLIPFENLGITWAGYIFYMMIILLVSMRWRIMARFKKISIEVFRSAYSIFLLTLTLLLIIHTLIGSVNTEESSLLVRRFFTQVLPVLVFTVFWLGNEGHKRIFDEIALGILRYGLLLAVVLILCGDIFNVNNLVRKDIADTVGMSPIAVTRTGCTLLITSVYLLSKRGFGRFYVISCVVGVILVFLGMSRGPLFSTILVMIGWVIFRRKDILYLIKRNALIFALIFSVVIASLFGLFASSIGQRYIDRIQGLDSLDNTYRFQRWIMANDFFQNEYRLLSFDGIFGKGPASFDAIFGLNYAHNVFLEFSFEYGLIGVLLISYLSVLISLNYRDYCRRYREREYLALLSLYLFISANFSGDLIGWRNLFFVTILLVISNKTLQHENSYS